MLRSSVALAVCLTLGGGAGAGGDGAPAAALQEAQQLGDGLLLAPAQLEAAAAGSSLAQRGLAVQGE